MADPSRPEEDIDEGGGEAADHLDGPVVEDGLFAAPIVHGHCNRGGQSFGTPNPTEHPPVEEEHTDGLTVKTGDYCEGIGPFLLVCYYAGVVFDKDQISQEDAETTREEHKIPG